LNVIQTPKHVMSRAAVVGAIAAAAVTGAPAGSALTALRTTMGDV
jgi:hypothetical protein